MAFLLSCRGLTRSFGSRPLFHGINLGIETGERIGVVGPNGSGKTTLLAILAGLEVADSGEISGRRDLRVCYVAQSDSFEPGESPRAVLIEAMDGQGLDLHEREHRADLMLARLGVPEGTAAESLSGGWRKRLAIARQIVREPDLLLLDEPTNHLDLEGILWLERTLLSAPYAVMAISHDRRFLETFASRILEVNPMYPEGVFTVSGNYSRFLEEREERFQALSGTESSLNVKVRREIEWLRRGAQARSTKAQGRIDQAMQMIDDLGDARERARMDRSAGIELSGSGRKTRELLVARGLAGGVAGRTLFTGLDLVLSPGNRLGIVGANGTGKTTLLRTLIGNLAPMAGEVRQAPDLKVAYFDQLRAALDPDTSLRDALSPNGDTVIYRGRPVHVASWAKRFLFDTARLEQPVRTLSGGEQSRVLIANLMLQPADILVMDEPTNDLDIPTLEVLEESLAEFPGAVVLVTHDRYLLDRVCDQLLVLGEGAARFVADTYQWEQSVRGGDQAAPGVREPAAARPRPVRLSTSERKELEAMEETILAAEERVADLERLLEDPEVGRDAARLAECWEALGPARDRVSHLYSRWQQLEEKRAGSRA